MHYFSNPVTKLTIVYITISYIQIYAAFLEESVALSNVNCHLIHVRHVKSNSRKEHFSYLTFLLLFFLNSISLSPPILYGTVLEHWQRIKVTVWVFLSCCTPIKRTTILKCYSTKRCITIEVACLLLMELIDITIWLPVIVKGICGILVLV